MKKLFLGLILICISTSPIFSQYKTIKGRVIDDLSIEPIPGVLIMINDSIEIGKTDLNGYFRIEIPVSENKIFFNYVGVDPSQIELSGKCAEIEVIMMMSVTYDFITLRRAERKRKKRFKKLPEIHKQAFDKGIFKTEYPCYNREFESLYLDK